MGTLANSEDPDEMLRDVAALFAHKKMKKRKKCNFFLSIFLIYNL